MRNPTVHLPRVNVAVSSECARLFGQPYQFNITLLVYREKKRPRTTTSSTSTASATTSGSLRSTVCGVCAKNLSRNALAVEVAKTDIPRLDNYPLGK